MIYKGFQITSNIERSSSILSLTYSYTVGYEEFDTEDLAKAAINKVRSIFKDDFKKMLLYNHQSIKNHSLRSKMDLSNTKTRRKELSNLMNLLANEYVDKNRKIKEIIPILVVTFIKNKITYSEIYDDFICLMWLSSKTKSDSINHIRENFKQEFIKKLA